MTPAAGQARECLNGHIDIRGQGRQAQHCHESPAPRLTALTR